MRSLARAAAREANCSTGIIDEVKIHSRALTQSELAADVEGVELPSFAIPVPSPTIGKCPSGLPVDGGGQRNQVALGMLIATACVGLWPTMSYRRAGLALSLAAEGILLLVSVGSAMPPLLRWLIPLFTLVGRSSFACSRRGHEEYGKFSDRISAVFKCLLPLMWTSVRAS